MSPDCPWFAFVVHPRDAEDLARDALGRVLRQYSTTPEEFVAKCCTLPPLAIGSVRFGLVPYHGELVCTMRMPKQLLEAGGGDAVAASVRVAAERGARWIGLGGLTAPVTGAGLTLVRTLPQGVTITNGNALTAAVARQNVLEAAAVAGHSNGCRVAVVGSTGSVGVAGSHLLADAGFDLVLIGRKAGRARTAFGARSGAATFSADVADIRSAQIVLLLTADPSARLTPGLPAPGTIVIDLAEPNNVAIDDREAFRQRGVDVVDGGFVRIPGYTCSYDLRTPTAADTFACLAETYLVAREGIREHSVGRPSAERAQLMERLAHKHGVTARPLDLQLKSPGPACEQLVAAGRSLGSTVPAYG